MQNLEERTSCVARRANGGAKPRGRSERALVRSRSLQRPPSPPAAAARRSRERDGQETAGQEEVQENDQDEAQEEENQDEEKDEGAGRQTGKEKEMQAQVRGALMIHAGGWMQVVP